MLRVHRVVRLAVCGWVALWAAAASAQSETGFDLAPEASFGCKPTGADQAPPYPEVAFERKQASTVRVRMTFTSPTSAPDAKVFFNSGIDLFEAAVLKHVKDYRLPCMVPGEGPLSAIQEFNFVPTDARPVYYGEVRAESAKSRSCTDFGAGKPEYIMPALVVIRMTFTDAQKPPQVDILYDGGRTAQSAQVLEHVQRYRYPCFVSGSKPVVGTQVFRFQRDGAPLHVIRDLDLRRLLAGSTNATQSPVRFDLTTMGCPFDLRFRLMQPYVENVVGEVGASDPNRREFIAWLRTLKLRLNQKELDDIIGQVTTLSVPCAVLDFTSGAKS